jgi:hypothetical protein
MNKFQRTTLVFVALFLLATLGCFASIWVVGYTAAAHCTYQAAKLTCTSSKG